MKIIEAPGMPKANGHYSQCVEHDGVLYLSGQLPIDPDTRQIPEGIEEQTRVALANVERILVAAGSDKSHVLRVRIYVSNIALWNRVNEVYAEFFGTHRPARAIVPSRDLHFGAQVEIECIAVRSR